ncbi:metallophosphoesterase family protein [Hoeflea sp.]|uniref:metallophosphoesterase family protein n=1 Tax=Hoeflea sp. TaxID=1940281 RepID=UPI003B01375B
MMRIHYAIGDVHGHDHLLEQMLARIVSDRMERHAGRPATIVSLGDYVDRGPDSAGVIDRLMRGVAGFDTVCLKGNHEAMLLACVDTDDRQVWQHWMRNGGTATMGSFGLDPARNGGAKALVEAVGLERIAFLRRLPLYHATADYLFVHAGIVPGRPIEEQSERDLLWIRDRFLDSDRDHGRLVIHGHTPVAEPDIRPNRIGIDTGAFMTGRLTAVVLGEEGGPRFLSVRETS